MPAARSHEVIPGARRLIMSLRDMGYDFAQAVADIVDNSIEAGASLVEIYVEFDGDDSQVRIADNGKGMTPDALREAMRYGAERDYDKDDLGKFGLGLKTASMSQCMCLTVASRWNNERTDISAYTWDLDHIAKTNRWEILPIERNGLGPGILEPLKDTTGTVVLWRRLDRILGYKRPYGENARKRLSQMCRDMELHLAMVFHRFISGSVPGKQLRILVNGNLVNLWDPFCRSEPKTKNLQPIQLTVEYGGVSSDVLIEPYILPHQDDFSTPEAFRLASGPANWNQQQGFYIYRAGRMIQSGGWSNLRAPDEHTKLARVAVSFSPLLDEAFKINVAKMRVQLPAQIRDAVRDAIGPVTKLAREIYDRKPSKSSSANSFPPKPGIGTDDSSATNSSAQDPTKADPATRTKSSSELLTFKQWADKTLAIAKRHERRVVEKVLSRLRSSLEG